MVKYVPTNAITKLKVPQSLIQDRPHVSSAQCASKNYGFSAFGQNSQSSGPSIHFFLQTLKCFGLIQTKIPQMHRKKLALDLFKELTKDLFENCSDLELVDIVLFEKELHILDVSFYDERYSRSIVVKQNKHSVHVFYNIPIAETSREKHETHKLIFRVGGMMISTTN